jgi:hypothetical protein
MRGVMCTARVDAPQDGEKLRWRNPHDRPIAQMREHKVLKPSAFAGQRAFGQALLLKVQPFARHRFECVALLFLVRPLLGVGIDSVGYQLPRIVPFLACSLKGHIGVPLLVVGCQRTACNGLSR